MITAGLQESDYDQYEVELAEGPAVSSFTRQMQQKIRTERAFQQEFHRKFSKHKLEAPAPIEQAILDFKPRPFFPGQNAEAETDELLSKLKEL